MKWQMKKSSCRIKNKTEFTAGMIGEATQTFQIMNPELLICTLDSSAKLDIELTIGKGRGYVPAEDNKPKDAPLGYIPIDSIYHSDQECKIQRSKIPVWNNVLTMKN